MIKIRYAKHETEEDLVVQLSAKGHAGHGEKGQDIVCAAVSTLMQTLAYNISADDAQAMLLPVPGGVECLVWTDHGEGELEAKFDLVADGLQLIAEKYPECVSFETDGDGFEDFELDLQMFAEGGGDGAAGGDTGATTGEAETQQAAPIEEPKLRPAQERLARRSGTLKSKGKDGTLSPVQAAEGSAATELPRGGSPSERKDGEEKAEPKAEEEKQTPEQAKKAHRKAFADLMQGEYAEEFQELVQRTQKTITDNVQASPEMKALLAALGEAYGTDAGDLKALTEAVKSGKVKDQAYYEKLATEKGVSVKTARELDKLESENRRLSAAEAAAKQAAQQAARQAQIRTIHAQWDREAAALQQQDPDFNLQAALANPEIAQMMRSGVSLTNAYRAANFDRLLTRAAQTTAQQVEQGVTERIRQRQSRPGENGTRSGAAATVKTDVANMTKKERERLEKEVLRGKIITFG